MKGMEEGSETRSSLLWQVKRLLTECTELSQVLVMENVPEIVGTKNMPQFAKWLAFLDSLGYKTKWQVLNTKDFGIPQNRARCFAVSVLGDYLYEPPKGFPLQVRLKDVLEKNVDEKYYLNEETVQALNINSDRKKSVDSGFAGGGQTAVELVDCGKKVTKEIDVAHTIMARDWKGLTNYGSSGVVEWKK